jgi:large subunit ribosomal protein L31e
MAEIKRTYNIPLRSTFVKKPKHSRAKVSMKIIKEFLKKHMKTDQVKLGKHLNEDVWKHGMKNPPHHVKVDVFMDDGVAKAELFGFKFEDKKKVEKKESFKDRLMEKVAGPQQTIVKKVKEDETAPKKEKSRVKAKPKVKKEEPKVESVKEIPAKEQLSKEEVN